MVEGVGLKQSAQPMTAAEYVDSHKPRIAGFAHTAPRYDDVTKPLVAPYPAACMVMAGECRCYSTSYAAYCV